MTAPVEFDDSRLQRMELATLWLQRLRTAEHDERLVEEWLDWCQRDPLNQQAFDEMAAVWEASGHLSRAPVAADAVPPAKSWRRHALAASVVGLGLSIGMGLWWLTKPMPVEMTTEFSSPIGSNSVQTLADGSLLELGGGTRVTVVMGSEARRVDLHEGEVFVTVSHDPERPFSVDTGMLEVIATGTAFNVLRTEARTTVTVAEGSVAARYDGQPEADQDVKLLPSQQLIYSHDSHRIVVRQAQSREAIAWRSGVLHFENEPLSEVVSSMNRYAAHAILIEDQGVGALSFTGTARIDGIESWLLAVPRIFPVTVTAQADGRQVIGPRQDVRTD